jgi:hypothetical protein
MFDKKFISLLVLIFSVLGLVFIGCVGSVGKSISFSDLISQAEKYNGKTVTLEAFYFSGFEISALSETVGPSTSGPWRIVPKGTLIWVEGGLSQAVIDRLYRQTTSPSGYAEQIGKLKVTGKFETGKFGHLDAYQYNITISSAEVLDWSPPPMAIPSQTESNILPNGVSLSQAKPYLVIKEGRLVNEDSTRTAGLWYISAPEADSYE